ncbi:hypothetical protein L596_022173 [Steinernema carpocapsae]|uniref:Uncharacterized protein n=1 Tax=Steinernema carpocapsae TaxID=34508 RepID=A0A4U5MKX1_STECR|nr:hypothetical protein L596_022173 [Steinernema carpocapsae]
MMAFDLSYLSIYIIEIKNNEYLEHELAQEDALKRLLPFLCQHIDDNNGQLECNARNPHEILKKESKIKLFVLYCLKDIYNDFLEYK